MKIATWNIGEDTRNIEDKLTIKSYEYLVDTIKEHNIDVICLQEAIIKSNYLPSIGKYINKHTNLKHRVEFELSDSHINIGARIGITICSKHKIENTELFLLDNPHLIYQKDKHKTYYSHDKGFIFTDIKGYKIITGHCCPFHIFNKSPLDYKKIYDKLDNACLKAYNDNNKFILCGDFNYDNIDQLLPNIFSKCKDLVTTPTRKDKIIDHFIISESIKIISSTILDNVFDHKTCIFEIK